MSQTAPLWKNGKSGSQYQYANHNRLQKEEPDTCRILELQEGFRARDDTYIYFVNHHEKYGWSVARAKLREPEGNQEQPKPSIQQDQKSVASSDLSLSYEQVKYMDSLGPMVAQILELCQEINDKVRKLFDRFDQSGGESAQ
jgi:hypothetical protein